MSMVLNFKLGSGVLFLKVWWCDGILHRKWIKWKNNS